MNHDQLQAILDRQDHMILDILARTGAVTMELANLRAIIDSQQAVRRGDFKSQADALPFMRVRALNRLDRYHDAVRANILESLETVDAGTAARLDTRTIEEIEESLP